MCNDPECAATKAGLWRALEDIASGFGDLEDDSDTIAALRLCASRALDTPAPEPEAKKYKTAPGHSDECCCSGCETTAPEPEAKPCPDCPEGCGLEGGHAPDAAFEKPEPAEAVCPIGVSCSGPCAHSIVRIADLTEHRDAMAKECDEQARLNGMGGEREAALLAKVAVLEAKLAKAGNVVNDLMIGTSPAGSSSLGAARDHAKRWLAGLREETFTRENP